MKQQDDPRTKRFKLRFRIAVIAAWALLQAFLLSLMPALGISLFVLATVMVFFGLCVALAASTRIDESSPDF